MARSYSGLPWKRNFRKIPHAIAARLGALDGNHLVVACAKVLTPGDFEAGTYQHLNLRSPADIAAEFDSLIPSPNVGRASFYNATDVERPDKSHGKIAQPYRGRAPHGKGGGSHPTTTSRQVWPRQLLIPSMSHLAYKRVGKSDTHDEIVARFQIQEVIDKTDPGFRVQLLRCLNLLQENTGKVDLFSIDAAETEFIRRASEDIGWELLPEADKRDALAGVARQLGEKRPALQRKIQDRFEVISKLNPLHVHHGTRGFSGYFAVEFATDLIAFENLDVDHALYVLRGSWQELGRLTRSALRAKYPGALRIVHAKGWEDRLARIVAEARVAANG